MTSQLNTILKNNGYNTLLFPLLNIEENKKGKILKHIGIIYDNDIMMSFYSDIISDMISNFDPHFDIKLYILYKYNIKNGPKNYSLNSMLFSTFEIPSWCESNDSFLKIENFNKALNDYIKAESLYDIIIFGHSDSAFNNSIFSYKAFENNINDIKNIYYVCFDNDVLDGFKYNIYKLNDHNIQCTSYTNDADLNIKIKN